MPFTTALDLFAAFLRIFLARTLAFSRILNTRNIECYWYPIWNHTLVALVGDMPHLLVAPQYTLWCVPPDAEEDAELPPQPNEDEFPADDDGADTDDDADVDEEYIDPRFSEPAPARSGAFDAGLFIAEGGEEEDEVPLADLSISSAMSVSQKHATTQVTDFAVVHVTTPPNTLTTLRESPVGRVFAALLAGLAVGRSLTTILRTRRADLPVNAQMPRILVEIKRFIHRHFLPGKEFNRAMIRGILEARDQLVRQATAMFYMPEVSKEAKVVILIAAVGPYYSTAHIRLKKKVDADIAAQLLEKRDIVGLSRTLITPKWSAVRYLGTEGSNERLEDIKGKLENWAEFEAQALAPRVRRR
ncbi:hypothetical protein FB451DRAFT_1216260 [Mycena latifolia]|nr:hypothetical protein FB451DRAFT_1216260 [Mycena latifolia]